jgi:hypothetical protein
MYYVAANKVIARIVEGQFRALDVRLTNGALPVVTLEVLKSVNAHYVGKTICVPHHIPAYSLPDGTIVIDINDTLAFKVGD